MEKIIPIINNIREDKIEAIKIFLREHWIFLCILLLAIWLRLFYFGHVDMDETDYTLEALLFLSMKQQS